MSLPRLENIKTARLAKKGKAFSGSEQRSPTTRGASASSSMPSPSRQTGADGCPCSCRATSRKQPQVSSPTAGRMLGPFSSDRHKSRLHRNKKKKMDGATKAYRFDFLLTNFYAKIFLEMKICFKCSRSLPFTAFYKHPRMADGHLGKCKECTKKDSKTRYIHKYKNDLEWRLEEMERNRIRQAKNRANNNGQKASQHRDKNRKYSARYPLKRAAHTLLGNAIRSGKVKRGKCEVCGSERAQAHHDDYHKPLDVRWLCVKHHAEHHIQERRKVIVAQMGGANE